MSKTTYEEALGLLEGLLEEMAERGPRSEDATLVSVLKRLGRRGLGGRIPEAPARLQPLLRIATEEELRVLREWVRSASDAAARREMRKHPWRF
jgi:hypothetical protein